MPSLTAKVCAHPGCALVVHERYCEAHAKAAKKHRTRAWSQGSARERGYTWDWEKYRARFLSRNPLCVECLKVERTSAATVVDHIVPHKGDRTRFWDPLNHQALCRPCHDSKTARGL